MGVLGGDLAGFPNGRRLADDVTDIELQAIGVQRPLDSWRAAYPLGDGVDANDRALRDDVPLRGPAQLRALVLARPQLTPALAGRSTGPSAAADGARFASRARRVTAGRSQERAAYGGPVPRPTSCG